MASPHPSLRELLLARVRLRWPILLAAATLLAMFFVPTGGSEGGRIVAVSRDFMHFPLFAILAAILLNFWPRHHTAVAKAGVVAGAAVVLALLIEVIQPLAGRSAAWLDVALGTAGSFAVAAVYLGLRSASGRAKRWLCATAGLLFLASCAPLAIVAVDRIFALRQFPLIDSFERPAEVSRWIAEGCRLSQTPDHATHGRYALKLEVTGDGGAYPGAYLADGVLDWRGYNRLSLDVFYEGDAARVLWIRMDDRPFPTYAERVQVPVDLQPGANQISIDLEAFARTPGGRPLDLSRVQTLWLFLDHPRPGEVLYLDHFRAWGRAPRNPVSG